MAGFLVISRDHNPALRSAVLREYPRPEHFPLGEHAFLVSAGGNAQMVARKLKVIEAGIRGTVVIQLKGDYVGLSHADVWDWLGDAVGRD